MEKILAECEYERWKPKEHELFWYLDTWNRPCVRNYIGASVCCNESFKNYNCFRTKEQAESESEKILVRRMLEDIARRLNKGKKIDWNNYEQSKHCIELYCDEIITNYYGAHKTQGTVYCLDKIFKDIAIQEIGEERLKTYLKGE